MLTRFFLPNLRARLVAVIFLALLPAFVLLLTVAGLERSRALENSRVESMGIAQLTKSYYADLIASSQQMIQWLAQFPEVKGDDPVACNVLVQQLFAWLHDYRTVSVADAGGQIYCEASPEAATLPQDASQQRYFQQALSSKAFTVGGFAVERQSGQPNLTFGYPILDDNGRVIKVVGAGLDIDALARRLSNSQFYDYVALLIVDANGTVVLRHPDPEKYVGRSIAGSPLFIDVSRLREGYTEQPGPSGILREWAFTTIGPPENPELYVLGGFTYEYILGGVNRMLRSTLLGLSVIGIVALVAAWLSAEMMIVRRTQRVVDAAERMRAGDFSARVGLSDDASEVGQLAQTFDAMAAALEEREDDNKRLLEEMQKLNTELESRVIKRTEQLQLSNSRLLESQAELRRLSEELMRVTENERTRISREIHDQLGQLLTAIKMELRNVQKSVGAGNVAARDRIDGTLELVDETIRTVRRISADLQPGILDDFGLAAAIEWVLQEFGGRTGIEWALEADLDEERLSKDMATAAFRICQEALTNVARHAEASRVVVNLATREEHFEATITDNGRGLPQAGSARSKSLGIVGMRERARQFGGSLEVAAGEERGVIVTLRFPLPAGAEPAAA